MIKVIADVLSGSGILDYIKFIHNLPKIEFDDLKKLEQLCIEKPEIAQRIVHCLWSFNGLSFYKEIQAILKENKLCPA